MNKEEINNNLSKEFFKTDRGKTESNEIEIPSITLPKGGGAIKGIDEKFSVNAVNGTSSFSIPLPSSTARGASPSLQIQYNSGAGNGIFGFGWALDLPSIKRKTDKELPGYLDEAESDTFLFSGAEDLVREFQKEPDGTFSTDLEGNYIIKETTSPDLLYTITYYKPRTEGAFARIEKWSSTSTGEVKWRVISKDNLTTLFGWSSASRKSDPTDSCRVFEWLPEFSFDDKGNCLHYIYKKEDEKGINPASLHNKNRLDGSAITYTNLYLEKVLYGNKNPYKNFNDLYPGETGYLFQLVFDYGEYDLNAPYTKVKDWDFRSDPFSEYKAGFEIRTTRLCRRVLLFHCFSQLPGGSALVRSLNFEYSTPAKTDFAFLKSVSSWGYIKKTDGQYTSKNLPPMEFGYQAHSWNTEIKTIPAEHHFFESAGIEEPRYQFTDLYNDGLPGILTEQGEAWYYKSNLGDGNFDVPKLVSPKPSVTGLGSQLQLLDLEADGTKQIVNLNSEPQGYFELNDESRWLSFRPFKKRPNINLQDANVRMIDLNGDGKPEILITEENVFTWYESEGRDGFSRALRTPKFFDEEKGPALLFSDPAQTIFLADMSGDGLTDIVRIRNGEVCYWPNLGYGRFGRKVGMDNSPEFDHPGAFNPAFLKLADIDGSGTTDIIYLGKNKFSCWLNLSGNSFSTDPVEIGNFPEINDRSTVTVTDLLGNGVPCIVWSSPLSKDARVPLQYIDLMNSKKPHLLVFYKNNYGKEVSLEYTPSTRFYLEDRFKGKPWVTKLHFPVHCISKTEIKDRISGSRFVSSYSYHHGYYDHAEREFRGFGMVETTDTEDYEHWVKDEASNVVDSKLHQAPVVKRQWFHTGAFLNNDTICNQFSHEYWYEQMANQGFETINHETPLADAHLTVSPGLDPSIIAGLTGSEWREALRSCKGMVIRSEVFAFDAPAAGATSEQKKKELTPYSVSAKNCIIQLLQPRGQNKHAVFIVKESENITYSYERSTNDPRIAHTLNIKLDEYGNVIESASVVYPRLTQDASLPLETREVQNRTLITYSKKSYTNDINNPLAYKLRLPSEVKTYELRGVAQGGPLFLVSDFENILTDASDTDYHQIDLYPPAGSPRKRLIENIRTLYMSNNLEDALPLHQLESLGFTYESYQLAYTPTLLNDIFGSRIDDGLMEEGKFTHRGGDDSWWVRSGTIQLKDAGETAGQAKDRFFLPVSFTDPYGAKTKITYDEDYHFFIKETEDPLGNKTTVELFNYRTLVARRMRDPNHNLSEVITDEFGLVKATALFGKGDEADNLEGLHEFSSASESTMITNFFGAPNSETLITEGKNLLHHSSARFVYDFDAYKNSGKPVVVASIIREEHFSENSDSPVQISFEYFGGQAQVVMKKAQAEPGKAKKVVVNSDNSYTVTEIDTAALVPKQLRWIGSGRTVVNNKGNPVKQYESYYSVTQGYEDYKELVETGVTPVMYYDAPGRLIKTIMADLTFTRTEFDSWKQTIYDANDTVTESSWYKGRSNRLLDAQLTAAGKDPEKEKAAAEKAAKHDGTPGVYHFDTLGRPILSIEHNKHVTTDEDQYYFTRAVLDIEGNMRSLTDARGNETVQFKYDMLGSMVYQRSMDAGRRYLLFNITGAPLRTWDERGHTFCYYYDTLHRPAYSKVTGGEGSTLLNHIYDRYFYGESETEPELKNLRGQLVKHYDTGGVIETPEYDFKGQAKSSTRKLFKNYKGIADWKDGNLLTDLESESFIYTTQMDALGRIKRQIAPDGTIITPAYNEAGLLNSEEVAHASPGVTRKYIKDIDYNEKGQRSKVVYGNDVTTNFHYDSQTFRLIRLETKRRDNRLLQDLHYTYDPVGNITHIEDRGIPTTFFDNHEINGVCTYTYDALYRLVEARGRENDSPLLFDSKDNWNDLSFMHQVNPGDPVQMRNYVQSYQYDQVGNILQMRHRAQGNNWTRDYNCRGADNRLEATQVGSNIYTYEHHNKQGFITSMPHLQVLGWNFKEELVKTVRQRRTDGGTPETTYYQYDGQGQRIRKITEDQAGPGDVPGKKDERIYIKNYELYKRYSGTDAGLERTSLSLIDGEHRFVMIDTETKPRPGFLPGRTGPVQTIRYKFHNHIGSAVLELDQDTRVISYEEFHPFGTTAYQAKNASIRAAAKRYRYTGMERDEESGLSYHSARYYLPWLGRWLSADPIGIEGGINLYAYSGNRPVGSSDPTGLWEWPSLKTVAIVTAVVAVAVVVTVATAGVGTAAVGAAVGAAGLSGTAATVATGAGAVVVAGASGAAGSVAATATSNAITGSNESLSDAAVSGGVAGVVTLGFGAAIGTAARSAGTAAMSARAAGSSARTVQAAAAVARTAHSSGAAGVATRTAGRAALGGSSGYVGGATQEATRQVVSGERAAQGGIDWGRVNTSGASGAVGGAVSGPILDPVVTRTVRNINVRARTMARVKEARQAVSEGKPGIGPAYSETYDPVTRDYYPGRNQSYSEEIQPIYQSRMDDFPGYGSLPPEHPYFGKPGQQHAEISSSNSALKARQHLLDRDMTEWDLAQTTTSIRKSSGRDAGAPFRRCPRCEHVTEGIGLTPDVRATESVPRPDWTW